MKKVISGYTMLIKRLEEELKIETTILDNTNGNMYILIENDIVNMCDKEERSLNLELKVLSK
jgi:hypothetical protein